MQVQLKLNYYSIKLLTRYALLDFYAKINVKFIKGFVYFVDWKKLLFCLVKFLVELSFMEYHTVEYREQISAYLR